MKLIEGMKKVKDLQRKLDDLKSKIKVFCSDLDYENPHYGSVEAQAKQVGEWLQACHDIVKEILKLRLAIQRTNIKTKVAIEIGGVEVMQSIAAWIHRRRDLATSELSVYQCLTDKGLKDGQIKTTSGEMVVTKVRRYFSPQTKDKKMEEYMSEPSTIDGRLEVVNAVTDLDESEVS